MRSPASVPIVDQLLSRWRSMASERALVDPFYHAASMHFDPLQARYWGATSASRVGPNWNGDLYSGAGIASLNRLSNFLQGNGTPASATWLRLQDLNPELGIDEDANQFWADATRLLSAELRGSPSVGSSFYTTKRMQYRSMGISYGVSYIYEEEQGQVRTGGTVYEAIPSHSFWYQLDAFGRMECGAYRRAMTEGEAQSIIGKSVIDAETDEMKHAKSSDRVDVLQMVLRNRTPRALPRSPDEFPFVEYWIHEGDKRVMKMRGYYSQPFHVMGWNRLPHSNYYVGPCYDALPDMVGATSARKSQLQAMAWAGSPPLLGSRKIENAGKSLQPRRITWNALSSKGTPLVQPMNTGQNPGALFNQVQDDESRVRSLMFNDEMLTQRRPNMTATEATIMAQERAAMVAPFSVTTIPSIRGEVARHFEIDLRAGKFPSVPDSVLEAGDFDADVVGPLAIAARQSEVGALMQTMEQAAFIMQTQNEYFDIAEAMRMVAEQNGHAALLVDPDEVREKVEAAAAMQNEAMQSQIDGQDAMTAKTTAEALAV